MESYQIEATDTTPAVRLDRASGVLEISGVSTEQDALGFYYPVIQWLDTYITHPQKETVLNLKLRIFNTATSKSLFEVFKRLGDLRKKGFSVSINWYSKEGDDSLKEDIEYFNDMTSIPINIISH